ncbi:neuropeptide Y receptor type 2 [Trichinella spiralis]|uniref:neuropeptide Y receptor type 2 n=1 Tax=Trichinella spiralis TaxID=6334 RepID=UPI0001EFC38D|nr:neuropeptide Y receptor type 2 [Trichinella spiralis]
MDHLLESGNNTASNNFTTSTGLHQLSTIELVIWFILYAVIAFLTVAGNALVIYVFFTSNRLQVVTNFFIVNLAVADLMTGLLAIPFKFQAALLQRWFLPSAMCSKPSRCQYRCSRSACLQSTDSGRWSPAVTVPCNRRQPKFASPSVYLTGLTIECSSSKTPPLGQTTQGPCACLCTARKPGGKLTTCI